MPELHALVEGAYRGEGARAGWTHEADLLDGPRTSAAALEALIRAPDEVLLAALDGEAIVGCVQVTRRAEGLGYLGLLTVDPRRQAGGLGRRLIGAAEAAATGRFGATRMELSVVAQRAELIAYYGRRGYRVTGEKRPFPIPLDPPLELVVMEKALAADGR